MSEERVPGNDEGKQGHPSRRLGFLRGFMRGNTPTMQEAPPPPLELLDYPEHVEGPFLPEKEITKRDWSWMGQAIDYWNGREYREPGLRIASDMMRIFPERRNGLPINNQQAFNDVKGLLQRAIADKSWNNFLGHATTALPLFPNLREQFNLETYYPPLKANLDNPYDPDHPMTGGRTLELTAKMIELYPNHRDEILAGNGDQLMSTIHSWTDNLTLENDSFFYLLTIINRIFPDRLSTIKIPNSVWDKGRERLNSCRQEQLAIKSGRVEESLWSDFARYAAEMTTITRAKNEGSSKSDNSLSLPQEIRERLPELTE